LQGPEQPLDASLGLGTVGRNPFDPQFPQGTSELRESFFSAQLFLEGSGAAAMAKNAVLIGVMRQRTSIASQPGGPSNLRRSWICPPFCCPDANLQGVGSFRRG
jgi:hypothetical protein